MGRFKFLAYFLVIFLSFVTPVYAGLQQKKSIRVAILQDAGSFNLRITGPFEIVDPSSGRLISRLEGLNATVVRLRDTIRLGSIKTGASSVMIRSLDPSASIAVNGRLFRDYIRIIVKGNGRLTVVNAVNIEDYVKGILYHEASHYWPMEALKVQAVVSRTYALYQASLREKYDYDLTGDIFSQVYGGKTSERERTSRAVMETAGEVLTFKGQLFPTYFHATCSGHTQDASLLWDISISPLKGVSCNYCKESPHYTWNLVFSLREIEEKLAECGKRVSRLKGVEILGRDVSGRVSELRFQGESLAINIPAKDFRACLGPNLLRSLNFDLRAVNGDIVFSGTGWGHGVGLCQWGAYFQAKNGRTYKDILTYYYPGSLLVLRSAY